METRAHFVLIGAFTLATLILAAAGVLWLGKVRLDREWDYYDVVFEEPVTGLTLGGAVQYNGIQVGEVRKLSIDPRDLRRVVARVRVVAGTPVKTDTQAKLTFTGLTFVAIIQLFGGTPESAMLSRGGQDVPVIVAETSSMQKLVLSGESMIEVAQEVLLRLSSALEQENVDNFSATLSHVETITGTLSDHDDEIVATMSDLREASGSLKRTLALSEKLVGRLDSLAASSDQLVKEDMRALLVAAARLAEGITLLLEQNRAALASFSNQDLAQVAPTLAELRATAKALKELATQIERDPQRLIRGKQEKRRERAP